MQEIAGGLITRHPEAWKILWLKAKAQSPVNRNERHGDRAEIEHWNARASSYAEHVDSGRSRERRDEILSWIESRGALQPEFRVLDIGAGPGNFAAPMCQKVAEVTAVEPSEGMVSILRQKAGEEGITNLRVLQKTWEEVDLQTEDWSGAFDLVFASMSPGVSNPDMLEKMLASSKAFCYLSGWSGGRWGKWGLAQSELWPEIFGKQLGDYPSDILYPFGMLYAMGYRPELRFKQPEVHLEMVEEEAVEGLSNHFSRYVEVDSAVRTKIATYVHNCCRAGIFTQVYKTCQGFMLWRIGG
jgi:SAM-dependent methyltransferase